MTSLLFSSRCEVITKESDCDWFSFQHSTVLIQVYVAHTAWSRHNEAGLYRRGSALCIVQFGVCFPLADEWEPPIFRAVVTPLEAGPPTRAGSADPAGRADHLCLGSQLPFRPQASGMRVPCTAKDSQLSQLQTFWLAFSAEDAGW